MRITNQREIILDELRRLKTHPTADELYELVKKRLPRISLATVYRNLEQMAEAGIINKIEHGTKQKRFDGNTTPHSHVFCIKCGRIADIDLDLQPELTGLKCHEEGWKIFADRIEINGLCPVCQREIMKKAN